MFRRPVSSMAALLLAVGIAARAAAQIPSTDVYLLQVQSDGDGYRLGVALNVSDREGYDNQPKFLPDGTLVYASLRDGQTDVYRYDPETRETIQVTATPESEYSPTPIPGRDAISVVRDYGEGMQQLWAFPLGGGEPERLLTHELGPIGYHAWVDAERLILFVLGEPMTLQLAEVGATEGRRLADNPGRALAAMPGGGRMSFVLKLREEEWWVGAVDPESVAMELLVRTPVGREDYAWAPDGSLWIGDGSTLRVWRAGEDGWTPVRDLAGDGVAGITRLAFDPSGEWLALVGERPAAEDETAAGEGP